LPLEVRVDLHSDWQYLIYGMSSFILKMGTGWLAEPPRLPDPTPATLGGAEKKNGSRVLNAH